MYDCWELMMPVDQELLRALRRQLTLGPLNLLFKDVRGDEQLK